MTRINYVDGISAHHSSSWYIPTLQLHTVPRAPCIPANSGYLRRTPFQSKYIHFDSNHDHNQSVALNFNAISVTLGMFNFGNRRSATKIKKKKDCNRILCVMKAPPTNTNRSMDTDTTLCQFNFAFHFNHVRNPTKIKATHVGLLCCVARVCNGTLHIHAARLFHHPKQMNSSNFDYTFFLFLHSRTLSD